MNKKALIVLILAFSPFAHAADQETCEQYSARIYALVGGQSANASQRIDVEQRRSEIIRDRLATDSEFARRCKPHWSDYRTYVQGVCTIGTQGCPPPITAQALDTLRQVAKSAAGVVVTGAKAIGLAKPSQPVAQAYEQPAEAAQ